LHSEDPPEPLLAPFHHTEQCFGKAKRERLWIIAVLNKKREEEHEMKKFVGISTVLLLASAFVVAQSQDTSGAASQSAGQTSSQESSTSPSSQSSSTSQTSPSSSTQSSSTSTTDQSSMDASGKKAKKHKKHKKESSDSSMSGSSTSGTGTSSSGSSTQTTPPPQQ
jgi:cytoskeletal protein RodZ